MSDKPARTGEGYDLEDMMQFASQSSRDAAVKCIQICRRHAGSYHTNLPQYAAWAIAKDIAEEFGLTICEDGTVSWVSTPTRAVHETPSAPIVEPMDDQR